MSSLERTTRQQFPDGSSLNIELQTVTFGLTLPLPIISDNRQKAVAASVLHCLARCIETQRNPLVVAALKSVFDLIHDRATPDEQELFHNWFDSR